MSIVSTAIAFQEWVSEWVKEEFTTIEIHIKMHVDNDRIHVCMHYGEMHSNKI